MGPQITSRVLPGIGVCHELSLHDGRHIAIVSRRDGIREFVVYDDAGDPAVTVALEDDEADAVAGLLGAPELVMRLSRLQRDADAVLTEQLPIPSHSPFVGRPLGDTRARTRTGASIVAVLRDGITRPSPGPDFDLDGGDLVFAVGTREGLDQLGHILDGTG